MEVPAPQARWPGQVQLPASRRSFRSAGSAVHSGDWVDHVMTRPYVAATLLTATVAALAFAFDPIPRLAELAHERSANTERAW